jgi:hypothetical protein
VSDSNYDHSHADVSIICQLLRLDLMGETPNFAETRGETEPASIEVDDKILPNPDVVRGRGVVYH